MRDNIIYVSSLQIFLCGFNRSKVFFINPRCFLSQNMPQQMIVLKSFKVHFPALHRNTQKTHTQTCLKIKVKLNYAHYNISHTGNLKRQLFKLSIFRIFPLGIRHFIVKLIFHILMQHNLHNALLESRKCHV